MNPLEIESFKVVREDQVKENFKRIKAEALAILQGQVGEDGEESVTINLLKQVYSFKHLAFLRHAFFVKKSRDGQGAKIEYVCS